MNSYNIVLLSGSFDSSFEHGMGINFYRALKRIGEHSVTHIDYKKIYDLNGPRMAVGVVNEELRKNDADIVIFSFDSDFEFPIEYFSELRNHYFTVMYIGDDEHYFDKSSRYYSQGFDLVMTLGPISVSRFELYGVDAMQTYIPLDSTAVKDLSREKVYDVCFVGNVHKVIGRKEYLGFLADNGVNVEVFGYGTVGGVVSRPEMNRIYASSKIGLSFAGVATGSGFNWDLSINKRIGQIKARPVEVAFTGSFVLAEYAPGIEDYFKIGEEIDIFRDKDELFSKVKYYLDNEAEREEMAAKAFKRAMNDYDEVNAWKRFLKTIDSKINAKERLKTKIQLPIYKDPIFKRAYSSFHLFKLFEDIFKFKPRLAWHEFLTYIKYPLFDRGIFVFLARGYFARMRWLRSLLRK